MITIKGEMADETYFKFEVDESILKLDLSDLNIKSLEFDKFQYLPELEILYLSNNAFKTIPFEKLRDITNLKSLKIDGNELNQINFESLSMLKGLEYLFIRNNSLSKFPIQNLKLPNLKEIWLNSNSLCDIELSGLECNLPELQYLILDNNLIYTVTLSNQSEPHNLSILSLAYNHLSEFNLTNINEKFPNLENLILNNNMIEEFSLDNFTDMNNFTYLNLGENRIREVKAPSKNLEHLTSIYLDHNNLEKLSENFFDLLPNILDFDISYNDKLSFNWKLLKKWSQLERINLSGIQPAKISEILSCIPNSMKFIDLSNNTLSELNLTFLEEFKNLEELNLSYNSISDLSLDPLVNCNNLKLLDVKSNKLKHLDLSPLIELTELSFLDLSSNYLETIDFSGFEHHHKLRSVNLSNNKLMVCSLKSLNTQSLEYFDLSQNEFQEIELPHFSISLNTLDLSNNELKQFNLEPLGNSDDLEVLNLANNKLDEINVFERQFNGLKKLYLQNNLLNTIPHCLINGGLRELDLSDNVFVDCYILESHIFTNLEVINLSKNLLEDFDADFLRYSKGLKKLNLSSNQLQYINLENLPIRELEELELQQNKLSQINFPVDKDRSELQLLILSENNLQDLEVNQFSQFTKLQYFYLNGNLIENIDLSPLTNLQNLILLDISDNFIESLDLTPLQTILTLKYFSCSKNRITQLNLNPLGVLSLEFVDLTDIEVEELDISCLVPMKSLKEVHLDISYPIRVNTSLSSELPLWIWSEYEHNLIFD